MRGRQPSGGSLQPRLASRGRSIRHLRRLSLRCARPTLWLGGLFIAANTVMTLLAAGQYALAVVAFILAIGGLAACAVWAVLLED